MVKGRDLKVGDRVKVVQCTEAGLNGREGTVRKCHSDGSVSIEFDEWRVGHSLGGLLKSPKHRSGWNMDTDAIYEKLFPHGKLTLGQMWIRDWGSYGR